MHKCLIFMTNFSHWRQNLVFKINTFWVYNVVCNCVCVWQLHLSFSLSTAGEDGNKKEREAEFIPVQSLHLLLKSIGATLTDAQDVLFKYLHWLLSTRSSLQFLILPRQTLRSHSGFLWISRVVRCCETQSSHTHTVL